MSTTSIRYVALLGALAFVLVSSRIGFAAPETQAMEAAPEQELRKRKPERGVPAVEKLERRPGLPTPKGPEDPDLRAEFLDAITIAGGSVQVNGRITNVGGGDFVSGPGQAEGRIVLHLPHLSGPEAWPILHQVPITRLDRAQSITLYDTFRVPDYFPDFVRWGHGGVGSGECAAHLRVEFIIQVGYDPDLHDDGNEQNDDSDHGNDQASRDSTASRFDYTARCPD